MYVHVCLQSCEFNLYPKRVNIAEQKRQQKPVDNIHIFTLHTNDRFMYYQLL